MGILKFEEKQQFRPRGMYFIYFFLLALLAIFLFAGVQQIIIGKPFGDRPAPNFVLITATLFLLTFFVLLYQAKLETLINDEGVFFRWTPIQKAYRKFAWSEIQKMEFITYSLAGYGWRFTPYGIAHHVNGDRGIQLHLRS